MRLGHDPRMVCQMCPDHNRVRIAGDDARNILYRLNHLFEEAPQIDRRKTPRTSYFHEPVRCSWTGSTCSYFRRHEHELRRFEDQLEEGFARIQAWIKDLTEKDEKEKVDHIRHECHRFFRGHYPMAARAIMQER